MAIKPKQLLRPGIRAAAIYAVYINVLIYLLFLIMFVYGRSAVIPVHEEHHPPVQVTSVMMIFGLVSTYVYVFLLFCINFAVLKKEGIPNRLKTVLAVIVSLAFIFVWNKLSMLAIGAFFDFPEPDWRAIKGGMMRDVVLGAIVVFSSQIMYLSYRRQLVGIENETLRAEYERARYQALKNQVDPHFLFNTLNTLNSVIVSDPKKAQRYVQKMSAIFRYTIQSRDAATLEEEIAFTRDYCELMQIRYGSNLNFDFDISARYNAYRVEPFSIQTLVENAIKHNVITDKHPLTVTISTDNDDSITVSNPVNARKDQPPGEGIGLANLAERYKLKWRREITIRNEEGIFCVRLPLLDGNTSLNETRQ